MPSLGEFGTRGVQGVFPSIVYIVTTLILYIIVAQVSSQLFIKVEFHFSYI